MRFTHTTKFFSVLLPTFLSLVLLSSQALAAGGHYYARQAPWGGLLDSEKLLADEIRQAFVQQKAEAPAVDKLLVPLARYKAKQIAALSKKELVAESKRDLKPLLLEAGVGDDLYASAFIKADNAQKLASAFAKWATKKSSGGWTNLGLGVFSSGEKCTGFVILTNRPLKLKPVPRKVFTDRKLWIEGYMKEGKLPSVYMARPDGFVERYELERLVTGGFALSIKLSEPGTHLVQIVAQDKSGPKSIATMPVDYEGRRRRSWVPRPEKMDAPDSGKVIDKTFLWLSKLRRGFSLSCLKQDRALSEAAGRFAREMAAGKFFRHSTDSESSADRIARSGLHYKRFGENLARGNDPTTMLDKLWQSPVHRYNLMDKGFNRVGLGTAQNERGQWYLVILFGEK